MTSPPTSPLQVQHEREVEQPVDARARAARELERLARARAIHQPQAQPADPLPRVGVLRGALGDAHRRLLRQGDGAHVLVDPRGEPVRRGAVALDARPVADRAPGRREVAGLPERERHQPQHRRVARVGVARVDEAPGGEREVALRERVLGGGHEALHALGAGVGRAEVDELERVGGHGAHARLEAHARPLLDVVAARR